MDPKKKDRDLEALEGSTSRNDVSRKAAMRRRIREMKQTEGGRMMV